MLILDFENLLLENGKNTISTTSQRRQRCIMMLGSSVVRTHIFAKSEGLLDHLGNDDEPVTGQDGKHENDMIDRSFGGWNLRNFVGVYLISFYYFIPIPHSFLVQYHSVVWEC
jgi:hypothetical protein